MKKLLVFALATIGMVACFNEEVVQLPKSDTIRFADAYINNSTRAVKAEDPSTTKATLEAFDVWAYMTSTSGTVLVDEDVKLDGGDWDYANLQYWTPNKNYFFAALAPMNSNNWDLDTDEAVFGDDTVDGGAGLVTFTNVDGSEDLLYATAKVTTPDMSVLQSQGMETVKFQFQHLLSKVKFTFKNGFLTDNATIKVENIKMTAPKSGSINLGTGYDWELDDVQAGVYEFGNAGTIAKQLTAECDDERLTIPAAADYTYTIDFKVTLYYGDEEAYSVEKTSTVTGVALEMGKAYNFVAEITPDNLNLLPIVFEVVGVDEWVDAGDVQVDYFFDEASNTYSVATAEGIEEIVAGINAGELPADTNVALAKDIDLAELSRSRAEYTTNWTPLGTEENPFTGNFNGNGYTIKNLCLVETEAKEGKVHTGFIGFAEDANISNVTFENVYINIPCLDIDHSQGHIGAVVGTIEGTSTIENVTVKGDIKIEATPDANGASRVAVVAGGNYYANVTIKNVHVVASEGSYLKANNNTGAIAGQLQGKTVYENCSSNIDVTVNKFFAGGIVGLAGTNDKFINCHTTGNIAVVAGRAGRANDHYRVGGIAGGWSDGKTNVLTLENCSYTGTISGKNSDGSVAEVLDYMGYVGRGYTLKNCAGSKVVIDGTEFVQKYDDVYGVYTINGCTPVSTADELVATLAAGEGVYLLNDITLAATKGGYNKAGILQNKAQTIDGGGHTLTVTGAGATWDCAIYTNGGVIRNLTVAGAMRGIFTAGQSSDLHIENVVFKNVIYTFNSDGKMPANPFGVYVSNSTVNGWTSHSDMHTEVVYTNCSFGEGSGYAYCRPYGKTAFVNCTFSAGYSIDKTRTTELTFTNCTFEE